MENRDWLLTDEEIDRSVLDPIEAQHRKTLRRVVEREEEIANNSHSAREYFAGATKLYRELRREAGLPQEGDDRS